MFEREFEKLVSSDREAIEKALERSIRDLLAELSKPSVDFPTLALKSANIKAVFNLASIFRSERSQD